MGQFSSESELCDAFSQYATDRGFVVYPETSNFDLLLVCEKPPTTEFRAGDYIGVQAKMRAGVEVLAQTIPNWSSRVGPDFYVILVPEASETFEYVANSLRLDVAMHAGPLGWSFHPKYRYDFFQKPWVPEVRVETPAGVPSPRSVTKWKLAAVRICMKAEDRGFLTAADFSEYNVDMRRWRDYWLEKIPTERGPQRYKLNDNPTAPHRMYPEIMAALRAKDSQM